MRITAAVRPAALAAALAAGITAGCREGAVTAVAARTPRATVATLDTSAAGAAAASVARALAVALADSSLRMQVLEHLRDSPFPKHALHATKYLVGKRGASLLAHAAKSAGQSPAEFLQAARALDGFALSAPYTATRALWTGDAASIVVVGSALSRAGRVRAGEVTGYAIGTGQPVRINTNESSGWYVLAIYPAEERAAAFGDEPEEAAASAPHQRRPTISTTDLEMAEMTAAAPGGTSASAARNGLGTGDVRPNVCLPDDPGCIPRPDPTPAPPAPQGYAPSEVGGWDWNGCTYAYGDNDRDQDGVRDECEYQLASAFRPYLSVADNDRNLEREPYWAASLGTRWYDQGRPIIQIVYALSYHHDNGDPDTWGFSAHKGDSEFIHYWVEYVNGRWMLTQVFTSAHWNDEGESSRTSQYTEMEYPNGRSRTRPLIYVSRDKHANYNTRSGCNFGAKFHADDCIYNRFVLSEAKYDVEVLPGANLGNKWAPGGRTGSDGLTLYPRGVQLYDNIPGRHPATNVPGSLEWDWRPEPLFTFCGWEANDLQRSTIVALGGRECAGPYATSLRWLSM